MKTYTIEDAKAHVEKYRAEIMENLAKCKEAPEFFKTSPHFIERWQAGCFLNYHLQENGATDEEVHTIGFTHGQRSAFGDPWKWAVIYLNQYVATNSIKDRPGDELADQINNEVFARAGLKRECN